MAANIYGDCAQAGKCCLCSRHASENEACHFQIWISEEFMERPIVRDILFLQRKAEKASKKDSSAGRDLADTLEAHRENCVGMAANMIGIGKAIIAIKDGNKTILMYNPEITKTSETSYETEEGCLSLFGKRPCKRYDWVEVRYEDENFHRKKSRFKGFTAEIVQHEMDHLQGILI